MAKRQRLTFADKQRLMNAVRAVPVMRDPQHRQQVVDNLIEHFGAQCEPARFQDAKFDSWSIARTCISHNAVFRLVSQLRNIGGASQELRELDSVVREFLSTPAPEVGTQDEICHQITSLLQDVSGDSLAAVLSHPSFAGDSIIEGLAEADDVSTGSSPTATGADAFARLMNGITAGRGRQLLVVFLELAAHQLEEYDFVELHVLAADLIGDSGDRTRIRELCQSLQLTAAEPSDGESTPGEEDPLKTTPAPEKVEPRFTPPAPPTPPVLWGGVPPRNSNFTGREALLDEIYESLDQYMQSALLPQPLHGLGGVGKSQMAVEFAYRYQFGYQLVWWIQADDVRSIRRSLVSLARRMGLPESDDVQDTVDTVLDALRRGTPHARWLLIYDNAPEPGIVHQYLPSGPGHVLTRIRK